PIEHITRGQKDGSKKQITNSAQGPPTIPNDPEGTPPPRGQTLRLRRRPPSKRHRVKPTVDSPEGTGNYSLNTITTANAFHSASIESSRSHPTPFNPITELEASRNPTPLTAVEFRSPTYEISTHPTKPEPLHFAGTGTGVDGAEEASVSRRTNPRNLTAPHHDRALTPETDLPWTSLFQRLGKVVGREDKTEAEIDNFTGG
ncbi:hypothetical protein HID58_086702, partial [Brassica napus]